MLNLNSPIKYSKKQKNYIKKLGITKYKDWDAGNAVNKAIKKQNRISKDYGITPKGMTYMQWGYQREKKEREEPKKCWKLTTENLSKLNPLAPFGLANPLVFSFFLCV